MRSLVNSEDPDEMPHNLSFCHYISVDNVCLEKYDLQRKKNNYILEIITYDPSINTMDHFKL